MICEKNNKITIVDDKIIPKKKKNQKKMND